MNDQEAVNYITEMVHKLQPYHRIEIKMTDRRVIVVERKINERKEF